MFKIQEKVSDLPQCHQCTVQGPSQGWDGREGAAWRGLAKFSSWEFPQILWAWSGPWWLHCLQECWGSLSSFKGTKPKYYFILSISDISKEDSKVAWVFSSRFWRGVGSVSHCRCHTAGQRWFGIWALSCALSSNSIWKIPGKLGIRVVKKSPGLQVQHKFRCLSTVQCGVLLENQCLQTVIPFIGSRAEWLQAVPGAALQICLGCAELCPLETGKLLVAEDKRKHRAQAFSLRPP